jgi:hypothetical protein
MTAKVPMHKAELTPDHDCDEGSGAEVMSLGIGSLLIRLVGSGGVAWVSRIID